MLYDRKVKYLDYLEGGVRVRGGGFAKLEARDGTLRVELSVTGLHQTDTFARDVMLCGRNREGRDREENCGRIEGSLGSSGGIWRISAAPASAMESFAVCASPWVRGGRSPVGGRLTAGAQGGSLMMPDERRRGWRCRMEEGRFGKKEQRREQWCRMEEAITGEGQEPQKIVGHWKS